MPNGTIKILGGIMMLLMVFGCSSKKYSVRTYIQEKERVDQEVSGTVGNWDNAPQAQSNQRKSTRKIYVLEVNKEDGVNVTDESREQPSSSTQTFPGSNSPSTSVSSPYEAPEVRLPGMAEPVSYREKTPPSSGTSSDSFIEYVVEKDDTLQKIAKKFYDSYSKWPKIYEVNKEAIPNPDAIQPGTKLRIPVQQ